MYLQKKNVNMKTLKEIAKSLNVSEKKASDIKQKIESREYPGVPSYMIWGTGKKKEYNLEKFKRYLNNEKNSK